MNENNLFLDLFKTYFGVGFYYGCYILHQISFAAGNRNYSNASLYEVGTNGRYWSSTVTGSNSYYLYFNSSGINPSYSNYRGGGFSVRCVAELSMNLSFCAVLAYFK